MTPFDLVEPGSLQEAARLLDREGRDIRAIAGGTAVMLMMKLGVLHSSCLISLRGVERQYFHIEAGADGALHIGAMATLSALERSPTVAAAAPVITRTLRTLANVRVRNVATLGGHLAHADPHMDLPPVLIALGASVSGVGAGGAWQLPLEELYSGYLETVLARDELIGELIVPRHESRRAAYLKCTTRSADDWPALGVAVALDTEGARVREARVVVSAATDRPTRLPGAEDALRGARLEDAALARAGEAAAREANIVADQHGSAAYKRELLRVYVGRALRAAVNSGHGS